MNELNDAHFIINAGPGGTFLPSGEYHTSPEDVDAMFKNFETNGAKHIAIYFHGGLVNESAGLNAARNIAPHIIAANCAPVCFVWETGLLETFHENISKIREMPLFNILLKLLLRKISEKIGLGIVIGRGSGSGLSPEQIDLELQKPYPFAEIDKHTENAGSRDGASIESLEALDRAGQLENRLKMEFEKEIRRDIQLMQELSSHVQDISDPEKKADSRAGTVLVGLIPSIAKVAYKCIKRFISKRDHGFMPTVVEELLRQFYISEIGAWIWKGMKDKSAALWESNEGLNGLHRHAGRYFLDQLTQYISRFPETEVSLIGHSAGSIAICNLLNSSCNQADLVTFKHIIFLAPACRTELFEEHLLKQPDRFQSLRIFTMSDENECKDALVPYIYPRSLLYLISGVLEDRGKSFDAPILGLERHIAFKKPYGVEPYRKVHEFLYFTGSNRCCFSKSLDGAGEGLQTQSLKHGDFDDDIPTLNSITYILSQQ